MSHCFNFDKMQYPNLPFKYLEVEVDNENIIYPILVRIQEISFGAGVQAQLTGGTYLWQRLFYSFCFTVFCLIWFFYVPSTNFQLCRDGSSCVEPVISKD